MTYSIIPFPQRCFRLKVTHIHMKSWLKFKKSVLSHFVLRKKYSHGEGNSDIHYIYIYLIIKLIISLTLIFKY